MTSPLSEAAEEALATFKHHRALADLAMERFLSLISHGESIATGEARVPRCVRVWAEWLAENGPATRQTITEATDVKFSERGTPHTVLWDGARGADVDVPPGTIVRFKGRRPEGRGAGPAIYALWSQRYDVLPLFGVGPNIRDANTVHDPDAPSPLLGVLSPTDYNYSPGGYGNVVWSETESEVILTANEAREQAGWSTVEFDGDPLPEVQSDETPEDTDG